MTGGGFRSAEIVEVGGAGNPEISPLLCGATGHGIDCCQDASQLNAIDLSRGGHPKKLNFHLEGIWELSGDKRRRVQI